VYFIHYDLTMNKRQSDGVEFCVIPDFNDQKIYFYCSEIDVFWSDIEDAGDNQKCKSLDKRARKRIRPATLEEICNAGLIGYVDSVKEYSNGGFDIKYIHLNEYKR